MQAEEQSAHLSGGNPPTKGAAALPFSAAPILIN
jgi:hypothetical protein